LATFEFLVEGPAVSLKAKKTNAARYRKWIRTIRSAAEREWPSDKEPTNSKRVTVKIVNYYTQAPPDVDNIIKPILDALATVAYSDDGQVHRVASEKITLRTDSPIQNQSALVAAGLEKYSELLHIVVTWDEE